MFILNFSCDLKLTLIVYSVRNVTYFYHTIVLIYLQVDGQDDAHEHASYTQVNLVKDYLMMLILTSHYQTYINFIVNSVFEM